MNEHQKKGACESEVVRDKNERLCVSKVPNTERLCTFSLASYCRMTRKCSLLLSRAVVHTQMVGTVGVSNFFLLYIFFWNFVANKNTQSFCTTFEWLVWGYLQKNTHTYYHNYKIYVHVNIWYVEFKSRDVMLCLTSKLLQSRTYKKLEAK